MAFQGTLSGGKLVLPKDVASIQVSSISQATFKSLSLNSYDFDHPRENSMKNDYKSGTLLLQLLFPQNSTHSNEAIILTK